MDKITQNYQEHYNCQEDRPNDSKDYITSFKTIVNRIGIASTGIGGPASKCIGDIVDWCTKSQITYKERENECMRLNISLCVIPA